jgi:hypothetical protein
MTGHRHPTKRCDTCEFWAPGDQWPIKEKDPPDDRIAQCHRNAPRASLGDFEFEVLNLLSLIECYVGDTNEKSERETGDWEEACLRSSSWPATHGSDWCGEWQPQSTATREETI